MMPSSESKIQLKEPLTKYLRQDFTRLTAGQTVGQCLEWLRKNPSNEKIVYFYVVDDDQRLVGVVPTRRLILSSADTMIDEIMLRDVVALPGDATVQKASEALSQHRLLAIPVLDDRKRILGVFDVDQFGADRKLPFRSPILHALIEPFDRFVRVESSSGILLLGCAVIAVILANSPVAKEFAAFWHLPLGISLGDFQFHLSLQHWINDGLMSIFFFVVGLEIKRELASGDLNNRQAAMLPLMTALGGMLMPALTFLAIRGGTESASGWGIPVATDIAFVVGFLALLGGRVPSSLRILLLTLAIFDDIGATLLIALVYSASISLPHLAVGIGGFAIVGFFQWLGVRMLSIYFLLGFMIWIAFVKSGIHPTVVFVALGLMTPTRPWLSDRMPTTIIKDLLARLRDRVADEPDAGETASPVDRLMQGLHPWTAYFVMPLFALANAGVAIEPSAIMQPTAMAVAIGLLVGKPIGIVAFAWLAELAKLTRLPKELNYRILLGAGCLAGIGFTMSLFIANLAVSGRFLEESKIGVLIGSSISALTGTILLWWLLPAKSQTRT